MAAMLRQQFDDDDDDDDDDYYYYYYYLDIPPSLSGHMCYPESVAVWYQYPQLQQPYGVHFSHS